MMNNSEHSAALIEKCDSANFVKKGWVIADKKLLKNNKNDGQVRVGKCFVKKKRQCGPFSIKTR